MQSYLRNTRIIKYIKVRTNHTRADRTPWQRSRKARVSTPPAPASSAPVSWYQTFCISDHASGILLHVFTSSEGQNRTCAFSPRARRARAVSGRGMSYLRLETATERKSRRWIGAETAGVLRSVLEFPGCGAGVAAGCEDFS